MSLLEGRVAVVTGAANGLGREVALTLARAGASVVVVDLGTDLNGEGRSTAAADQVTHEILSENGQAVPCCVDISSRAGAEAAIRQALDAFGQLDILVNAAGYSHDKALLNLDQRDFTRVIEVHLTGTFLCLQAAAVVMRAGGSGSIINTTSQTSLAGHPGQSAYAAAAAGIHSLTRSAAAELQRYGIRVNAVAPLAKTRQTEQHPLFQKARGLGPEHVAPAYLYLASNLAADTTGRIIAIAGDRMSTLELVESAPTQLDGEGIWTPSEVGSRLTAMLRQ